jgi:hypothetical protein
MAPKIIQTQREFKFIGRMETQTLSYSYGRERRLLELANICHGLRRLDRSFRGFKEICDIMRRFPCFNRLFYNDQGGSYSEGLGYIYFPWF